MAYKRAMEKILTPIVTLMPLWFGLFFLGPVLAEITLLFASDNAILIYPACMTVGGVWGFCAHRFGRWI